ncbi:hypothetical protein DPV78_010981 [Talaromyces pinophilus]|nr:hypothetical protein DPV78_010981 [Talaromyces pinophilus]
MGNIKPNNILEYEESPAFRITVKSIQISDLEDTGNSYEARFVKSPKSWCQSRQNQASDVFSFGIMMIYMMVNEMVFRVSDDETNSVDSWRYILDRHISYFADEDGLNGLLERISTENPFYERLIDLANSFGPGNPRQPFQSWSYVELERRDLVGKMTSLDPTKKISAREALQHR